MDAVATSCLLLYPKIMYSLYLSYTYLVCIPMFWKAGKTLESLFQHQSKPANENPIWLPLQSEYHIWHKNVMQLVYQDKWVPMQPPKTIFQNDILASPGHFIQWLRCWQWKRSPMGSWLAFFQDGCHTHLRNANHHNSVTNQLTFIILVLKVWFWGMLNLFQGLKNNVITTKTEKLRLLPILTKILLTCTIRYQLTWNS